MVMSFLQPRDLDKEQPEPPVTSDNKPASKAQGVGDIEDHGQAEGKTLAKDSLLKTFAKLTSFINMQNSGILNVLRSL